MKEYVILVDMHDKQCGKMEKMLVHQLGLLHRAFSVFIFNSKGELLLQQRADSKYHSAGLWTNTCCSHPRVDEAVSDAIKRRLKEEMGLTCKTNFAFNFTYKTIFENGLIEHELDHVHIGFTDDLPILNQSEVKSFKYMTLEDIEADISVNPHLYTEWMKICLAQVKEHFQKLNMNNS